MYTRHSYMLNIEVIIDTCMLFIGKESYSSHPRQKREHSEASRNSYTFPPDL